MKIVTLIITILAAQVVCAQPPSRIYIEAGSKVSDVLTPANTFHYPVFKAGKVLFKDGVVYDAKLNYNIVKGEVEFISPQGDTLAIAKEQVLNIKRVVIDTISFVYNKNYLQVIAENKMGSLVKRQRYSVALKEKMGAYNTSSSTSSVDSYNSFVDWQGNNRDLVVRENITLLLKTDYLFSNKYNLFLPASRKSMERLFFKKKAVVDTYLQLNAVDFNNEQDLKKMFTALEQYYDR